MCQRRRDDDIRLVPCHERTNMKSCLKRCAGLIPSLLLVLVLVYVSGCWNEKRAQRAEKKTIYYRYVRTATCV